ncbi:MAG: class I SAM-dependent methyltransferase [Lachnospiraceae bacterium]|nr:class I SAM-dependent methyltransferase [Lachnospiraceae bacterium]
MQKSFNEEWESIHSTQEWGVYPTEHVIRFIARNYYKTERDKVKILDFGCGAGAHTWYLAREGFDTYAFDGSMSAVERAKKRLNHEHLNANFKVMDALDVDYPDNYFDAVVDNVCVYGNLIENINSMYKNIYRMLKPQGKLLTTCFGKRTDGYGTGEPLEKDTYVHITEGALVGRGTTHFYDKEELGQTLKDAGFKNTIIDTVLYTDRGVTIEQFVAITEK